jgi:hypothetical protein
MLFTKRWNMILTGVERTGRCIGYFNVLSQYVLEVAEEDHEILHNNWLHDPTKTSPIQG